MTRSELHVAQLAASGLSNSAIAVLRQTSVRTVANQMGRVLRQLGIGSRLALATRADVAPTGDATVANWSLLTERQREVLARIASGTPQKVVAIDLGVSASTVSGALREARARLGFASIAQMVAAWCAASR
jgi:DNA-binding CsgD family transcriptional regulator